MFKIIYSFFKIYELVANVFKLQDFTHRFGLLASRERETERQREREFRHSTVLLELSPVAASFMGGRNHPLVGPSDSRHAFPPPTWHLTLTF